MTIWLFCICTSRFLYITLPPLAKMSRMKKTLCTLLFGTLAVWSFGAKQPEEWTLVWSDEFNTDGRPDEATWSFEQGFVRNHEDQWYQAENAWQQDGLLIIEARRDDRPNPTYRAHARYWGQQRERINYTSACLHTRGKDRKTHV